MLSGRNALAVMNWMGRSPGRYSMARARARSMIVQCRKGYHPVENAVMLLVKYGMKPEIPMLLMKSLRRILPPE